MAAGNEAQNACDVSPAREPSAFTVGASTQSDSRAWFSNFGSCVDLFAPGESIVGAGLGSSTARQTMSGTSMASPHAAGAAAIAFTAWPTSRPAQIIELLISDSTRDVLSSIGAESPNRLLMAAGDSLPASDTPSTPISVTAEPGDSSVTISWTPGDPTAVAVSSFTVSGLPEGLCTAAFTALEAQHSCTISGLTNEVEHTFSVVAVNAAGVASAASNSVSATPSPAQSISIRSTISPIAPTRVADTRQRTTGGRSAAKVSGDRVLRIDVTDALGLAPNQIEAVALNLTLTATVAQGRGGFATVFPCNSEIPYTSSLNFVDGATVATGVISAVSMTGEICVYVFGEAHVIVDVTGVIATGQGFHSFVPQRQTDTRSGLGSPAAASIENSTLEIRLSDMQGINLIDITAISATLTVTSTVAQQFGGYATVFACDREPPNASTLNFRTGKTVANSFISPISADGRLCVYIFGSADVIVDINGVFTTASAFTPVQPSRVMDTRSTIEVGTLSSNSDPLIVPVSIGSNFLAKDDTVVTLNVTAVGTTAVRSGGFLTVYPCGTRPNTSTLNFVTGQTIANSVVTPLSADGTICVYVYGKADVLIDVNGISRAQ